MISAFLEFSMSEVPPRCQINLKLSKHEFDLVCDAAKRQQLAPMRFCIDLVLAACGSDTPLPPQPAATALVTAIRGIIDNLAEAITLTRQETAQAHEDLQAHLTKIRDDLTVAVLATLQETIAVRTIADNHAATVFTGDGEMKELRTVADTSKARLATKALAALLTPSPAPAPSSNIQPERNSSNA